MASPIPSFTLSISPTTRVAKPNQAVSYTVTVAGANGFRQPMTLTVAGLPTGVDPTWSTNPVTPDSSSILTLSVSQSPPFGHHPLEIVGMVEMQTVTEGIELIIDYPARIYLPVILGIDNSERTRCPYTAIGGVAVAGVAFAALYGRRLLRRLRKKQKMHISRLVVPTGSPRLWARRR